MKPNGPSTPKSFLDTSTVFKIQTGLSIQREYLAGAIPQKWYINNYVRMEFYRRLIIECIEVYFESADPIYKTLGEVFNAYSDQGFGRQPKIAAAVMANMQSDGYSLSSPNDKEPLRQLLQDFVFAMSLQFRETFVDMGKDPSQCSRLPQPIKYPHEASEREAVLRRAALTFGQEEVCRKRCTVQHLFQAEPYKDKLQAITSIDDGGKSLERIQRAVSGGQQDPSRITCKSCSKMGDAVIASSLDAAWKLHSMDGVHRVIAQAIDLSFEIHPSLAALMRPTESADNSGE